MDESQPTVSPGTDIVDDGAVVTPQTNPLDAPDESGDPAVDVSGDAAETPTGTDSSADSPADSSTDSGTDVGGVDDPDTGGMQELPDSGLLQRDSLPELNLPLEGSTTGDYRLVNAYPNLSFQEALYVADVPGQNRMLVVEQKGRVKVFDDDPDVLESRVIVDLSDRVVFSGEQGLLGLAFDPDFVRNQYVYVYYTAAAPERSTIVRFIWDDATDTLALGSAKTIIDIPQPYHSHNGGMIEFGPDGYLYLALGDGGDGGDPHNYAQDLSELLGSVLRLDVHPANPNQGYAIPADNPYVGEPGVREEIFAHGFRNPFRFSFDRATGDLWLGDVGQAHREEVNVVRAGGNYGWRVFEGTRENERALNTLPDSAFIPPVHEYGHNEGLSVIGGYVYRGSQVNSLTGRYIFADFYSGVITALNWDGSSVTARSVLGRLDGPTSFGETRDGELLVVSRYQGIFRFENDERQVFVPWRLSETGLFEDVQSLTTVAGLVEYEPAVPFWSDGAHKRRWIGVPDTRQIGFSPDEWQFPIGSVSVKHFDMWMTDGLPSSLRRLETRILYHTRQGWEGFSYRWDEAQQEAYLVNNRQSTLLYVKREDGTTRRQNYVFPGRGDCSGCHNQASEFLLGPETRQMNTTHLYATGEFNQIDSLKAIDMFDRPVAAVDILDAFPSPGSDGWTVAAQARAYLDVNCGHCHQPGGTAPTSIDLRYETPMASMNAVDERPQSGSLGVIGSKIINPGAKESSVVWLRMNSLDEHRMPPVSSHRIDEAGVELIGRWIDGL